MGSSRHEDHARSTRRDAGLVSGFLDSARRFPDRPALEVAGEGLSYARLADLARSLATTLARRTPAGGPELTAVFAHRSRTAFVGVLGSLLRGHGYVPLNCTFPPERSRLMLERAGCKAVVVDEASAAQLDAVLAGNEGPLLLVLPDLDDVSHLRARWPGHEIVGALDLDAPDGLDTPPVDRDALAYLLFTSGSTGIPKGVAVAQRNVCAFLDAVVDRYGVTETDRLSQTFDLTFDLSAFDMFVAWERGACLCCPPQHVLIKPDAFIRDSRLTIWFSVPSTAVFMKRLGSLKPGRLPDLRWSLFCGEPLPVEVAEAWAEAAPGSIVENLYGPTELTIACTVYRWAPERSATESLLGLVPIGTALPGMSGFVADEQLREVAPGEEGELLMTGPQLTLGYWDDPERTAVAFVRPPGRAEVHYRTGDRVRRPTGPGEPLLYLGRLDHQLKIQGHRVELGEIEAVLRDESGVDAAIAMGWPRTPSGAGGVVAFLGSLDVDVEGLRVRMAERLPSYMVPREIHLLSTLPLNANGKFDRNALAARLEGGL
jgi:amino acid adenylation domain-containing protein